MRTPQPVTADTDVLTSPDRATEVTNHSTRPGRTGDHPRWCDRARCITGQGAARHTSRATRVITGEQTFALTLIQHALSFPP